MKNIQDQLKNSIFEAVKEAYPTAQIKPEDIFLEHPTVEEHGDYSTNIALKLAKQLGNKKSFLENIDWIVKTVNKDNFFDCKEPFPVGKFSLEVQKAIGAKNRLVYLKPKVYAKVNGWLEGHSGHKEINTGYWYLLPLFLHRPSRLLRDKKSKSVFHFVIDLKGNLDVIVDLLYWGEDYAQISSIYFARDSYFKNFEEIVLDGGTAVPSYLSDPDLATEFGAGSRLSSLHQNKVIYNKLDAKSQEEILFYEEKIEPKDVAQKIVACLKPKQGFNPCIAGGFINIKLGNEFFLEKVKEINEQGGKYGSSDLGKGETVVIDYSAPNIAKPFGIGHLRSTIIGQALYNLYKFLGYKVVGDNHLGDWGTQFGKLMYMIDLEKPERLSIEKLEELYVKFHKLAETDKAVEDKGRLWFKKLEDGDQIARNLWQKCVDISMDEFNRIYKLLGVKIDFVYGEAFYESIMPDVIKEAKDKKVAHGSDGAWVIDIPNQKAPLMLVKSDGGTTYATRDLATLKFRKKTWNPDLIIYEVGAEQALHFVQLFEAAGMLGYVKDSTLLVHTKHGLYLGPDGKKFSTRKGKTVKLEEVLTESVQRAKELGSETEKTAKAVGIGAIKYFDLKHNVQSDIIFDWEKMFELEGDSGPYIQYTYARARSVLQKADVGATRGLPEMNDSGGSRPALTTEELSILRWLYRFPDVVEQAAKTFSPNLLCSYLFDLAKRFNTFYATSPILENQFRLSLTEAVSTVLKNGLTILGIEAVEKM